MEENQNTPSTTNDDYRRGAQIRKIFNGSEDLFGLPSPIFLGGVGAAAGCFFVLHWTSAIIAALLYFPVMYAIHREDPRAALIWRTVLSDRYSAWEAGTAAAIQVVIVDRK